MKLHEKEWVAINYFCNKRYRKFFITEAIKYGLNEGIADSLKKAWESAKSKAKSFLDSIEGAARDLIPDGFLVGLSRLGEKGKQIWEIVSTIGGKAYNFIVESVGKLSAYVKNIKQEAVSMILKIILQVVYKVNKKLYNQILDLCKRGGFETGLKLIELPPEESNQSQPQQTGQSIQEIKRNRLKEQAEGGNIRDQIANLVEEAFKIIKLSEEDISKIVQALFPFQSSSPEGVAVTLVIPLLQGAGSLNLDTAIAFFQQAMSAIKGGTVTSGFKLFKENSLQKLLIRNFESLKGAIVGLIRGSNLEMLLRAVIGGDISAGIQIVKQIFKFLIDKVKEVAKSEKNNEATEQAIEGVDKVLGLDESKISLHKILYTNL